MLEKLKSGLASVKEAGSFILGLVALILGALLLRANKKKEAAESELAGALSNKQITESDYAIKEQEKSTDSAVAAFRKLDSKE